MTESDPMADVPRLLVLAALAYAAACGGAPEPDKVLSTIRSWTATTQLASAEVRRGAVPKRLASQLHDRAIEARQESATALALTVRSPEDRQRAKAALDSLDIAIRTLGATGARE